MKKLIMILSVLVSFTLAMQAQKIAMVDMEYIMKNIPQFETAEEQLNLISKKWQSEVEVLTQEAQQLYKNYQTELVFLSDDMKVQREEEIIAKEKAAQDLKRKYFGQDGELFKKRESLMKPIQDEIFTALQDITKDKGYDLVFDRASAMSVIIASPKLDISDEVLQKLGYSK